MAVPLFFDVSGGELLLIMLFVLLFFGSKGIPGIARTMGRTMRQLRDATAEVQREIQRGADEVKQGFEEQRSSFRIEPPENAVPQQPASAPEPPAVVAEEAPKAAPPAPEEKA
jgi:sec-independent protein translocase protein TatA